MRFSVIMPLYNKAPYVKKALTSVISQTFQDFEFIVVNDGSTDNSLVVAQETLAGTNAIIIDQKNAGASMARNNGVKESSGDYICFIDADDWWAPEFLERMNNLIDEFPDAGIYGSSYYLVKNGKFRKAPVGVSESFEKGYIDYCSVYAKTLCMPLTSISVAIPRGIFEEHGGFKPNLKLGEDFDLWIRIALKKKVAFLNEPLAYYNQDVDVASRGTRHLQKPEYHMLWNLDYLQDEENNNPEYKRLIDNLRTYGLFPYYISKEYHKATYDLLAKVDWSQQNERWVQLYKKPLWYLRAKNCFMKKGSQLKKFILQII